MNDRTHGQQFKAGFLKTSAPTSVEGIEKYLASGMIRGIGPTYAKKLLRHSPADIVAACPTTVTRSRWLRALTRMTQKPFSAFW